MMPKKQRVLPHPSTLVEIGPNDEYMFKERYKTIKALVYELEDENNLVAFKIARTRARIEALRLESARQEREALEERTRGARVKTTTPPFSPTRHSPQLPPVKAVSSRDAEQSRAATIISTDLPDTVPQSDTESTLHEWPKGLPHPFPRVQADVNNGSGEQRQVLEQGNGDGGGESGMRGPDGEEDELMEDDY